MDKHAAAHVLDTIASYLELKGENPFKVRAFETAARVVETYPRDLAAALASGELAAAKGIGPATLEVVREVAATGRSSALDSLKSEIPPDLIEMRRIPGLGATKIRMLHQQLGIATLAELDAAARDGRLATVRGFTEKTAQKVLKGLEFLRRTSAFRLLHHAARTGEELREMLRAVPGVSRVELAGSLRRRVEVVRDLDVVVACRDDARALAERLRTAAADRLADGAAADIFCVAADRFAHAWVRATGSARHWEQLVAHAAGRGCVLDATGLTRGGTPVAVAEEEDFYAALGLAWIPPELREGADEIARAAHGRLPRLVERGDLVGMVHCHSVYSDGADTVAEMAEACRVAGFAYLGITDHSVAAAYAGGLSEAKVARQHEEIDELNRRWTDFRILKGIEADILADGSLDYPPEQLDRFEFVIGSVHSRMEQDEATMTQRVLRAMNDPHLTILGHPTGRLLLERDAYAIDMQAVIAGAAEREVAIEINGDPHRLDLDWRLCAAARDAGVPIAIGTDAHDLAGLENVEWGIGIAKKGGLEPKDVLNCKDAEGFLRFAQSRK